MYTEFVSRLEKLTYVVLPCYSQFFNPSRPNPGRREGPHKTF